MKDNNKKELTQKELEDIGLEKAGFTRAELEEMDRRAANEETIPLEKAFEIIRKTQVNRLTE